MKRLIAILLLATVSILMVSCSTDSKAKAIMELVSEQEGTYAGYLFWNTDSDLTALNEELLGIVNSDQVMSSIHFSKMNVISMNDESQKYNYVELFEIEKSPTLLIFDTEKLILKTSDLEDVYKLANELKDENE
jgi:hypothetical protein